MRTRTADIVQLLGVVCLVAAAWTVNLPVGLVATGVALLVVGLAADPRIVRGGDR